MRDKGRRKLVPLFIPHPLSFFPHPFNEIFFNLSELLTTLSKKSSDSGLASQASWEK